jgi:hypothetical protein
VRKESEEKGNYIEEQLKEHFRVLKMQILGDLQGYED